MYIVYVYIYIYSFLFSFLDTKNALFNPNPN